MKKLILCLLLIPILILSNQKHSFAEAQLNLEGSVIKGEKGGAIGYGLQWNRIGEDSEYSIWRYGSDDSREVFKVEAGENRYADTSIDFSEGYEYFIMADGLISNVVTVGTLNKDITAIASSITDEDCDYIYLRFSTSEPFINIEKYINGEKTINRKPYYPNEKIRPIAANDTYYLPIRAILEELDEIGGSVDWDDASKTSSLRLGENTITVKVLSQSRQDAALNGVAQPRINELVRIHNDRLLFSIDAINLLAGKFVINRNATWNAIELVYVISL